MSGILRVAGWGARDVRPTGRPVARDQSSDLREERGSATIETVLSLPSLIMAGFLMVWCLVLGLTNVRMAAAANEIARGLARGEPPAALIARVTAEFPSAAVDVTTDRGIAEVVVSRPMTLDLPLVSGLDVTVTQSAAVPLEVWSG